MKIAFVGIITVACLTAAVCFNLIIIYTTQFAKTWDLSRPTPFYRYRPNFIYVNSTGSFMERIEALNSVLQIFRKSALRSTGHTSQNVYVELDEAKMERLVIRDDDYLSNISRYKHITTIALPWLPQTDGKHWSTATDRSNVLFHKYYTWTGSKICEFIQRGTLWDMYLNLFRKLPCHDSWDQDDPLTSIEYAHAKVNNDENLPAHFYSTPPSTVAFIDVITGILVAPDASIIAGNLLILTPYCSHANTLPDMRKVRNETNVATYDEVFAMKHGPGYSIFHSLAEEIARVAPYVEFLKRNSGVKIHVSAFLRRRQTELLGVLGLDASRIVVDEVLRARIAYVPRRASCMMPRLTESQLLADMFRRYIRAHLAPGPRDTVLLINRTLERQFPLSGVVQKTVKEAARAHGFKYAEYGDNPPPSLNDTMRLFHSAFLVFGVDGAGLTNIYFSQPGTYVIEVVPEVGLAPMCFLQLAHVLGMRWHGIPASAPGFDKAHVPVEILSEVLDKYLDNRSRGSERT